MEISSGLEASQVFHRELYEKGLLPIWEQENLEPFKELIVSWSAERPAEGSYLLSVSLYTHEWSAWFDYARWGTVGQNTFKQQEGNITVYQDAIEVSGEGATGFRIRLQALEGASLKNFWALHVCASGNKPAVDYQVDAESCVLEMSGISQIALSDPRSLRICSPTSTTAVVNYLKPSLGVNPLSFADLVWDQAFDIYGNWILNTAQASHLLGPDWRCFVARLSSFKLILKSLHRGIPVVVSVRGPLLGSAKPYNAGHLLVVRGYSAETRSVLCMDPGFQDNPSTLVSYPLKDFLDAWNRRGNIAYLFHCVHPSQ